MANPSEPIIEPDLPIVDAHHHLWLRSEAQLRAMGDGDPDSPFIQVMRENPRYLLEEFLADIETGHNVIATVFVEAHTMYRQRGPEALRSVGEVEFINGVAAMAESGVLGPVKACAGIVGNVNLCLGDAAEDVLRAHIQAGNGRYRGVRHVAVYDADPELLPPAFRNKPRLLYDKDFRAGFKWLHKLGLSADQCVLEPQLPDLLDLARAFPETQIILNHVGMPVGCGTYKGTQAERFPIWRDNIRAIATCPNVVVKLGGLGTPTCNLPSFRAAPRFTSVQLAAECKPYFETCIEVFGADRCMFESNYPVDSGTCTYPVLWNTFKRIAAGASPEEKTALFSGTAKRVYRLDI